MTKVAFAGGGTGGHLFPALAIARAVQTIQPDWRVIFAGAHRGVEARVLRERGLQHRLFPFEPIYRKQIWRNLRWPFLAGRVVREVDQWLDEERPDAVVGTGGYVSGPVLWRASRMGIPTGILELDVRPGLATRLVASRVSEIWTGSQEAGGRLTSSGGWPPVFTGAPISPPDPTRAEDARVRFGIDSNEAVVIITGGSQGSLALNRSVSEWLDAGGGIGRRVIWVTGRGSFGQFLRHHDPPRVTLVDFLDPMADAWSVATMAVSRAGMSTLGELAAWGIPAIVVPLPSAAADHQRHNAEAAAAAGAAVHLPQAEVNAERLEREVVAILGNAERLSAMGEAAVARGRPEAASEIAKRVISLARSSS